jgi:endonuclease/exonuclease/phosphatase family metal-dependent hydrolase
MKIVSFNIRCPWKDYDGINDFIHRAGFVYDKIREQKPDVIAFQEIRPNTYDLLVKMLPEYEFLGTLREKNYTGEGLYTAIKKDSFAYLSSEVFWLSPTPFVVASRFENQSECSRICLMTKIRNKKTGEVFRVMNLHLDHISDEARKLGLQCALEFFDEYERRESLPTFLLGDFNAEPEDGVMQLANERKDLIDITSDIPVTFHGYGKTAKKIDYIYLSNEWKNRVKAVETWQDCHEGIFLSDHYPVCVTIED